METVLKILQTKGTDRIGGWKQADELAVSCAHLGRDEDLMNESDVAADFVDDLDATVTINAILMAPEKAVIAITELDGQESEDKVPYLTILSNDLKTRG